MLHIEITNAINVTVSKNQLCWFSGPNDFIRNTTAVNEVPTRSSLCEALQRFEAIVTYKTFRSHSYIHISALMFWISLMFWVSCDHNSKVIICNCLEFMLMANLCFGLWLEAKLGNDLECEYMFVTNFAFHSRCCLGFPHDHNMPQQSRAGKMEDNMLQIKVQQKWIITILMT